MSANSRNRGIAATKEGIEKIENKKLEKKWTNERLLREAGVSLDTLKRVRKGTPVDKESIRKIAIALELDLTDIVAPENLCNNEISQQNTELLETIQPEPNLEIKLRGTISEVKPQVVAILNALEESGKDKFIILGINSGSAVLVLKGSPEGLKRLEYMFKVGQLTEREGFVVEDVRFVTAQSQESILDSKIKINLTQWLQNNFAETIEAGWLTLEEIFGTKRPAFCSQSVKRAKQIQLGDIAINLLVELDPQPNQEINLFLGVYAATESANLPDNLQIEIVMEIETVMKNGEVLTTYSTANDEAVAWDDFVFEPGEQFCLQISLGELSHREVFQL